MDIELESQRKDYGIVDYTYIIGILTRVIAEINHCPKRLAIVTHQ